MHNHPSGDPHPSAADGAITKRLREAGDILQVRLLDHVIIGAEGHLYSFREAGVL
jgi:DNA repair protein RadC